MVPKAMSFHLEMKTTPKFQYSTKVSIYACRDVNGRDLEHDYSGFRESLLLLLFLNPHFPFLLLFYHYAGSAGSLRPPSHENLASYIPLSLSVLNCKMQLIGLLQGLKLGNVPGT